MSFRTRPRSQGQARSPERAPEQEQPPAAENSVAQEEVGRAGGPPRPGGSPPPDDDLPPTLAAIARDAEWEQEVPGQRRGARTRTARYERAAERPVADGSRQRAVRVDEETERREGNLLTGRRTSRREESSTQLLRGPAGDDAELRSVRGERRVEESASQTSLARGERTREQSTEVERVDLDGVRRTTNRRGSSQRASAADLTREQTRSSSRQVVDTDADAVFTDSESQTNGVSLVGGLRGNTRQTRRSEIADGEGNVIHADESSEAASVGTTYDEDHGWGLRNEASRRRSRVRGDVESSSEQQGSVQVQADRVVAQGSTEGAVRRGNLTAQHKVSADGSFGFDLEPHNDADPPYYTLTFRIHLGVAGSAGAGRSRRDQRGLNGSVGVEGSAGSTLTTTRRLTPEQAARYLEEAAARDAGGGRRDLPEFGRLDQLVAAGENADSLANGTAALGDASTARSMADGEAVELELEAAVGGNVSAGGSNSRGSVSVSAEARQSWRRTARVERIHRGGRDLVEIQVRFVDARSGALGANGTAGGVGVGARGSAGSSESEQVTVRLDPSAADYDAVYARVIGADSPSNLRAIAAREDVSRRVTERVSSTEDESAVEGNASGGGLGMSIGEGGRSREQTTVRGGHTNVRVEGEHTESLGVSVAGQNVLDFDQSNTATADVDSQGVALDLRQDEAINNPVANVGAMLSDAGDNDVSDTVGRAVSQSPVAHLRELLTEQEHHLRGYNLSPEETEQVVQRAGDTRNWNACCSDLDAHRPWAALGRTLTRHRRMPEGEEARLRRNLAIARAIAAFMREHGSDAQDAMRNVLRHYGERGLNNRPAEAVGLEYEWPPALSSTETRYTRLVGEVRGAPDRARSILRDDGMQAAIGMFERVEEGLVGVRRAVEGSADFDSPAAKAEMIEAVNDQITTLRTARARFRAEGQRGGQAGEAPPPGLSPADEQRLWRERISRAVRALRQNKREETRRLDAMHESLNSFFGTTSDVYEGASDVHALHRSWHRQVGELRDLYGAIGVDPSEWEVSTGPGMPRSPTLEPDVARLRRLYLSAGGRDMTPPMNYREIAAAWASEWRDY